jgi:hypothetical protein
MHVRNNGISFEEAKVIAIEMADQHQALYVAVANGNDSSVLRMDDSTNEIFICDGRQVAELIIDRKRMI